MAKRTVRHQRRLGVGIRRTSLVTCVIPAVARMIELEARKHNVCPSWVQARRLGDSYGYAVDHYDPQIAARESKRKEG